MLRIAFAGTPEFAVPALQALAASGHELVGVLTRPDRPAGRGLKFLASPVKEEAHKLGVPVAQPATLRSEAGRTALVAWGPDLIVVVAYGLILPQEVLALAPHGCLNIHASLLPRWRGAAPIQRAILAGDNSTGVTIMQLEAGLDTGPVLAQRSVVIDADTTAAFLYGYLARDGAELLVEVIADIESGRASPKPQPHGGITYAAKVEKREARIDWHRSAPDIARQVQAFNPWPVAETQLDGTQLRVWTAHALPMNAIAALSGKAAASAAAAGPHAAAGPGAVIGLVGDALAVRCGEGLLAINTLQLAGRRVVTAREFVRGHALEGREFA